MKDCYPKMADFEPCPGMPAVAGARASGLALGAAGAGGQGGPSLAMLAGRSKWRVAPRRWSRAASGRSEGRASARSLAQRFLDAPGWTQRGRTHGSCSAGRRGGRTGRWRRRAIAGAAVGGRGGGVQEWWEAWEEVTPGSARPGANGAPRACSHPSGRAETERHPQTLAANL